MSNIIHAPFTTPQTRRAAAIGPLLDGFATKRRAPSDVMWLKENGELLNILECTQATTGIDVPSNLLAVHDRTYAEIAQRIAFFPQYYRFFLSITLDLEALGMAGDKAEAIADWVVTQDLVAGETSDIQRLEAQRLLARRGMTIKDASDVEARLRAFVEAPEKFALPNKKAAYELTHIVFYLSDYGRKNAQLSESARKSLEYVGIWAFLDGNLDLLAEICIAMRYAGYNPNQIWEAWIAKEMSRVHVTFEQGRMPSDQYHAVFMGAWLGAMRGFDGLAALPLAQSGHAAPLMYLGETARGALGELSRHLFSLGANRSDDWHSTLQTLEPILSEDALLRVNAAQTSSAVFEDFFESFSRTSRVACA